MISSCTRSIEFAFSPTWKIVVDGDKTTASVVEGTIEFSSAGNISSDELQQSAVNIIYIDKQFNFNVNEADFQNSLSYNNQGQATFLFDKLDPNTEYYLRAGIQFEGQTFLSDQTLVKTMSLPTIDEPLVIDNGANELKFIVGAQSIENEADIASVGVEKAPPSPIEYAGNAVRSNQIIVATGLAPNTDYQFRTFVKLKNGLILYSNEISVTTLPLVEVNIGTATIGNVSFTSSSVLFSIENEDNTPLSTVGVVYTTTENPTIASPNNLSLGNGANGTNTYQDDLANLTPNTTYYLRPYVIINNIPKYGEQVSFTTLELGAPEITALETKGDTTNKKAKIAGKYEIEPANAWGTVSIQLEFFKKEENGELMDPITSILVGESGISANEFSTEVELSSFIDIEAGTVIFLRAKASNIVGSSTKIAKVGFE